MIYFSLLIPVEEWICFDIILLYSEGPNFLKMMEGELGFANETL
jgi:hypothetical protein